MRKKLYGPGGPGRGMLKGKISFVMAVYFLAVAVFCLPADGAVSGGNTGVLDDRENERTYCEPLTECLVTSAFGAQESFREEDSFHRGTDFAAPEGRKVFCIADGVVVFAGQNNSYGNYVVVSHVGNVCSKYAHLDKVKVKKGQRITGGEVLGTTGNTGNSTGPHLHLEITCNGVLKNPEKYLYP